MFLLFFIFFSLAWGNFEYGISLNGTPQYKKDFSHFSYVNPNTPKGGCLKLSTLLPFNSLNPYILNGITPEQLTHLTIATLFEPSEDEPASSYSFIAEGLQISQDKKSVLFSINKNATFSDGHPITADDVLFSFNVLREKGHPKFKQRYQDIESAKIHNPHLIEFIIKNEKNKNIPHLLSGLPILPKHFYEHHDFAKTLISIPPSSGPYSIQKFIPGKKIIYKRNKNWWAKEIPTQKGRHNFDYIEEISYREDNARFEAFKSHEFDLRMELSIQNWAKRYNFKTFKRGKIKKIVLPDKFPKPVYGIVLNARNKHLNNRNIRKALSLAFDFNWCNKNLFCGLMERSTSYFQLSKFSSGIEPQPEVLEVLKQYETELPKYIREKEELKSLKSDDYRENIKHALRLFQKEGYSIKNQKIVDPKTSAPLHFVLVTDSKRLEKIALFYKEQLKKHFGISLKVIFCDQQTYTKKIQTFDFDMAFDRSFTALFHSLNPGPELETYYSSKYANTEGSSNFSGIKNAIIDKIIESVIHPAESQIVSEEYIKTLDYLLVQEYYRILGWYFDGLMIAYWNDSVKGIEQTIPYPKNIIARLSGTLF